MMTSLVSLGAVTSCVLVVLFCSFNPRHVQAITLSGGETSYARYPVWNGCHQNGSFSFEFRTTHTEGLLWYVDDGGRYDFFMVSLAPGGRVRLVLNIVDGRDGNVEIILGVGLNDGRWHHVEVRRKRMETTMIVDGQSDQRYAFGSDFDFGNNNNSYVYLGGLPSHFRQKLESLALPSATFEPRFRGQIRNVMYGNCTCQTTRASLIDGVGVSQIPPEICEISNPCPASCVCVSTDNEAKCNCSQQQCVTGMSVHYELPMDRLEGNTVLNPSGLDARAFGSPSLSRGIKGKAIELDGRTKYVKVTGPGHRNECFGDLDRCPTGYTLSYWLNFTSPLLDPYRSPSSGSDDQFVYLSNGAHSDGGHGVAMIYNPLTGKLEMLFKRKSDGAGWRVKSDHVVPGRWYHVTAVWDKRDGLTLYVDGDRADSALAPLRSGTSSSSRSDSAGISGRDDFVIGRANDATMVYDRHMMLIDEVNFWSLSKNLTEVRELGPFYCYSFSMDSRADVENYAKRTLRATVNGNPEQVEGKMGSALRFDGRRDHIDAGDRSQTCLGNLTLCQHGITVAAWIKFSDLRDDSYILSTGSSGIKLYYKNGGLVAEAQQGSKSWSTSWSGIVKDKWHFVEMSWSPESGIKLFVDLDEVSGSTWSRTKEPEARVSGNLYIGKGSKADELPASVTIDDLEFWYGDRETLIFFDFISRGRPVQHVVPMDEIRYSRVMNPGQLRVDVTGQPQLVDGRFGRAVSLDGRGQHMNIERQSGECLGNLDLCRHGLLLTSWIKVPQLLEGMTLISTGYNGITARVVGGQLEVTARTTDREWTVRTDRLQPNQWQFLEIAWNPDEEKGGLEIYLDEQSVAKSSRSSVRTEANSGSLTKDQNTFFIGRGDGTQASVRYGNFAIDEFEYWYNNREYLIAFGYLQRGKPGRYYFDMNRIEGNRLVHPNMSIPVIGRPINVPGRVQTATLLNGNNQYVDIGDFSSECFGNLDYCQHGITGSMFVKPLDDKDGSYYLSTGGATRIYQDRGRLVVVSESSGKHWEVTALKLEKDKWSFVEYTWHPTTGLQVYVNNKKVGESTSPTTVPKRVIGGRVIVGGANPTDVSGGRFQYANAVFDEIEFWMKDRNSLIASGYIVRDDVDHILFPFELRRGNSVIDTNFTVTLHNGATLVPGRIGNGVQMEGTGEYVTFGNQQSSCMGNLELCKQGVTIKFFFKPKRLIQNGQFLAAGPYTVYSKDGKVFVKFSTSTKTWEVSTDKVKVNDWHKMEMTWDEQKGLELYVNDQLVGSQSNPQTHPTRRVSDYTVYLGRPTEDNTHLGVYADAIVDHLEYWFTHKDRLKLIGPDDDVPLYTQRPPVTPGRGLDFLPTRPPGSDKKWLVFDGKAWLTYDFSQLPKEYLRKNNHEEFHIKFQTERPEGLLWYAGNNTDNMHLSVKDGTLYLITSYNGGRIRDEFRYALGNRRLNDNQWHDVYVTKDDRQVNIILDGTEFKNRLSSDIDLVSPSTVYLAGSNNTRYITRSHVSSNFEGRIGEAVMSGNTLPSELNLIDLALIKPQPNFIFIDGDLVVVDPDLPVVPTLPIPSDSRPITFTSGRVYLTLPAWSNRQMNSLEFFFRTVEPRGLILYSKGAGARSDAFAVEMFDGMLYVVMNQGGPSHKFAFNGQNLNDGAPHHVQVKYGGRNLVLMLDGREVVHRVSGGDGVLDLDSSAMIGAADGPLPWHLWTMKQNYFKGCLWGLRFNDGTVVDLESAVRNSRSSGVEVGCSARSASCGSAPCYNNGRCGETWDGYQCDCSDTAFTGRRCETRASFVEFSGGDLVRITVLPTVQSHTNDISLRFKTIKEDGLLFATSTHFSNDYLKALLERGQVVVETNIDGQLVPARLTTRCDRPVNDGEWHTLHIQRRASQIKAYIDNCSPSQATLEGEGYLLNFDEVVIGKSSLYDSSRDSFIGHMQNFFFDDSRFFEKLSDHSSRYNFTSKINITTEETNILAFPVTFRANKDSYLTVPSLQMIDDMNVKFSFKTTNRDGLILYNGGSQGNFFAVELVNGILHVSANDGSGPQVVTVSTGSLADDRWHTVEIRQVGPQTYDIMVDGVKRSSLKLPTSRNTLDLTGGLYVGGVSESIIQQLPTTIVSRNGFSGCFATLIVNGRLIDPLSDAIHSSKYVTSGCTKSDLVTFCRPDTCKYFGVCMEELNGFSCDCNLTSFTGRYCTEEAEGFRYGQSGQKSITTFTFRPPVDTTSDKIAFGFNTWQSNGTLINIVSSTTGHMIDARLVNGHVVFTYDIGDGVQRISETSRVFNDGQHHYVVFQRTGSKATLRVDDFPVHVQETSNARSTLFRDMWLARIGGKLDKNSNIIEHFDGIISGVYINGQRVIDLHVTHHDSRVTNREVTVATHPFYVEKIVPPRVKRFKCQRQWPEGQSLISSLRGDVSDNTARLIPGSNPQSSNQQFGADALDQPCCAKPTDPSKEVIPPVDPNKPVDPKEPVVPVVPPEQGGGGVLVDPETGEVIISEGENPIAAEQIGSPVSGGSEEGARAAGVAGAMLGSLAAVSSLMWALYKFKPGLVSLGGGGSSATPLIISAPQATSSAAPPAGAGGPGGALTSAPPPGTGAPPGGGGGGGYGSTAVKSEMYNGSAGGAGGGVVAQQANLSQYFSSMTQSSSTGGAGGAGAHGAAGMSTMNRGIQTESAAPPGGAGGFGGSSMTATKTTTYMFENSQMGSNSGYAAGHAAGYNTTGSAGGYSDADGFVSEASSSRVVRSLSPPAADSSFQMRNMTLNYSGFNQQDLYSSQSRSAAYGMSDSSYSAGISTALTSVPPNLMSSEEIRVDCVQLTNNGRYVVTGSIYGPPQVWDMQTGELVRVMQGEDFSSTDLHLANGDTLLVGQVAELEQVDPNDVSSGNKLHYRKLQTWDFNTGQSLEMRQNELCTASCLMSDGERMVLGRTERFGGGTTIIIWDILGNEPVRKIKYDACVGFADHISYLNLSTDNRYVIAGFQNSFDGNANFISFDLTVNDINQVPPQVIALNAEASVTAVLENHEAVTGTRAGELVIWSMRTGKALRQLVSPGGGPGGFSHQAHQKEITDLAISKDRQYLVSASADGTLKIWNTESEKLLRVLSGHKDEVWCCCISSDNELIASGSRDNTIRLWRLHDGGQVAAIDTGVDVFKVLLSNNKKTVVALADKYSARKLIMLQVVRTKTKMTVSSRPTSPWATGARY